ncbi:endonuclease/exonuclease/phosphatase family protein [Hwangdonia lutea]|uniref:Endonuclease/exonuclease/phosphatase family protein n=1 Tax=Hwangdonia lutea TaxID=3075823 RepID=A0AA97ERH9_9FLAO|nr:endonuclease/exonuclease/phosphatase family protein [Hwangdonia sp. SCSIO 19198]WOD45170.1 endonuclease/exonuclease/phosphatase family protein [Hwangdonia sp. SCSIO 19198]
MLKIIRALYLLLNTVIILALLAIHFVFKEHSYQSSLLYYTFPLPVIILAVLLLSIFLSRKFRKFNLIIASLLLLVWLVRSFKINFPETIDDTDLEVVFWNASHYRTFNDAFKVNNGIPDVMVLVEGCRNDIEKLKLQYPDYYFYLSDKEIAIFSKTTIHDIKEKRGVFSTTVIGFKVEGVNFYAVDVSASLDVPRAWALELVNQHIKKQQNTVVLGDFNAPFESKHLEAIKTNYNHAFNEKGNGFRETWFWNIPLLSLDHIWISNDLEILKTKKIGTFKSDHSMLKTYVGK